MAELHIEGEIIVAADKTIELGTQLTPKFDANGLIPAIAQDAKTGEILMVAYMNREALDYTIKTGCGTYYSRSRKKALEKRRTVGPRPEGQPNPRRLRPGLHRPQSYRRFRPVPQWLPVLLLPRSEKRNGRTARIRRRKGLRPGQGLR